MTLTPGDAFYWALGMSVTAVAAALPVLALRRLRRVPRRVVAALWALPFLRMCVPVGLNSPFSLTALLLRLTSGRSVAVYRPTQGVTLSVLNTVGAAERYFPNEYQAQALERVFAVSAWVWIAVAAALVLTMAAVYAAALRGLRAAEPLGDGVWLAPGAGTPAVYGLFRPKIVVPEAPAGEDARYVLLHERAHIRRLDNLWRLLGLAAAAAHWFNPLAWVFLKLFLADLELACDESVLARLPEEARGGYARALLSCAEKGGVFASPFGGAKLSRRIGAAVSYRRLTAASAVGFAALAAAIAFAALTNAG